MSEDTQTEDEPSIEEILDSIRQIISEDEAEESVAEDEPAEEPIAEEAEDAEPEPEPVPEEPEPEPVEASEPEEEPSPAEEDILELTELVNTEENQLDVDMVEGEEPEEAEEEPVAEEPTPEPEPEIVPEPELKEIVTQLDPVEDDSLLTDKAETAAVAAISELVRKTAVEHDGVTIEEIVRAELKPLLRDWLDKHLPTVIERLVQEELERVSKRVLED